MKPSFTFEMPTNDDKSRDVVFIGGGPVGTTAVIIAIAVEKELNGRKQLMVDWSK